MPKIRHGHGCQEFLAALGPTTEPVRLQSTGKFRKQCAESISVYSDVVDPIHNFEVSYQSHRGFFTRGSGKEDRRGVRGEARSGTDNYVLSVRHLKVGASPAGVFLQAERHIDHVLARVCRDRERKLVRFGVPGEHVRHHAPLCNQHPRFRESGNAFEVRGGS